MPRRKFFEIIYRLETEMRYYRKNFMFCVRFRDLGRCNKSSPGSRRAISSREYKRLNIYLLGVLRTPIDDPYDQMRRNRLVEPRLRARSISPHRSSAQRDSRSQSMILRAVAKDRKGSIEGTSSSSLSSSSRSEWFDKEASAVASYDDRKSRPGFSGGGSGVSSDDWMLEETSESHSRIHSVATTPARLTRVSKKPRETNRRSQDDWKDGTAISADSRRSILECDVNPYLLLKKQRDEDDLSDDLSDNALEQDDLRTMSSLFDSSKVKSIERIPNRSVVAAIGGQRIRVFNEAFRKISDDDDDDEASPPVTRIPIPKVSPKRPPRRLKEARQTLKSILKRGRVIESKRKNVLFNVDNVIFAPEKPSEATRLSWSKIGRISNCNKEQRISSPGPEREEVPIVSQEQQEKPNFITIPNIKDPKVNRIRLKEPRIVPEMKKITPPNLDKIKIDKFVPSRKPYRPATSKKQDEISNVQRSSLNASLSSSKIVTEEDEGTLSGEVRLLDESIVRFEDETELEIEIEELKDRLPCIAVDEKDLILKSEGKYFLKYYKILRYYNVITHS